MTSRAILNGWPLAAGQAIASTPPPIAALGVVAGRLLSPPRQKDASKTYGVAETWHLIYSTANGQVEIWWPNFYTGPVDSANGNGAGDLGTGAAATATAQITYTDAPSGQSVTAAMTDKMGGTSALSAADGGWFKAVANINAAAGSVIYPRIAFNMPGGVPFSLGHQDQGKYDATHRDRFAFGTSPFTLSAAITDTYPAFLTWYGPSFIGMAGAPLAIGIVGDSIEDGIDDMVSDASGRVGFAQRLFASKPVINLCAGGDTAATFVKQTLSPRRWELAQFCDRFVNGMGINDFLRNGTTAAALETLNAQIEALLSKPTIRRTLTPFQGSDPSQRAAYNTTVRGKSLYFDPASVLENAAAPGTWLNEDAVAYDRLHPTAVGGAYAAANAPVVGTDASWGVPPRAAGPVMPSILPNLLGSPRDMTAGAWSKNGCTITQGAAGVYPDAEAQAPVYVVAETTANAGHGPAQGPISLPATAGTYELWYDVAPMGRTWIVLTVYDQTFGSQANVWFNIATGQVGNVYQLGNFTATAGTIQAIAGSGGFYRCKMTFAKTTAETGIYPQVQVALSNGGNQQFVGDTTKGFYMRPGTSAAVLRRSA